MRDIDKITNQLAYSFLRKIIAGLKDNSCSVAQAKQLAIEFKATEPLVSIDDARIKMNGFVTSHPEFNNLKEYVDAYHGEKLVAKKIVEMRKYIGQNKIDEALKVAQK